MSKKRRPRDKRVEGKDLPPFRLTDRDIEIIKAVNDCLTLKTEHVQTLFFNSASPTYTRLQKLYQHGYLERKFITQVTASPATSPMIYTITELGAETLVNNYGYQPNDLNFATRQVGNWQTLQHILDLNNFRTAITRACRDTPKIKLVEWINEQAFRAKPDFVYITPKQGKPQKKPILPDGYLVIQTPKGQGRFFIEVDRGREGLPQVKGQMEIYHEYMLSGQYEERFKSSSLRVLIVTTGIKRLKNIKRVVSEVSGGSRYWITTKDQINPQRVLTEPIWHRADSEDKFSII